MKPTEGPAREQEPPFRLLNDLDLRVAHPHPRRTGPKAAHQQGECRITCGLQSFASPPGQRRHACSAGFQPRGHGTLSRKFSGSGVSSVQQPKGMRCVGSCVCSVVISGTSRRTTRLRARSRTVFGAEPTGRRSLVTRDFDHASRPPTRAAARTGERVAESNGWDLTWLANEGNPVPCRQSRVTRSTQRLRCWCLVSLRR